MIEQAILILFICFMIIIIGIRVEHKESARNLEKLPSDEDLPFQRKERDR